MRFLDYLFYKFIYSFNKHEYIIEKKIENKYQNKNIY